jgi:hypothetical protein
MRSLDFLPLFYQEPSPKGRAQCGLHNQILITLKKWKEDKNSRLIDLSYVIDVSYANSGRGDSEVLMCYFSCLPDSFLTEMT